MDKNPLIAKLNKVAPDSVLESRRFGRSGITSIWLEAEAIAKIANYLRFDADLQMDWLENLSVVEFEQALVVTYFVNSNTTRESVILRISVVPASPLERVYLPSARSVWPMAEPMEKEAEDLFGVSFRESVGAEAGGQGLKANLLPENWVGFPLRKGYVFPKEVYGLPHSRARKEYLDKKVVPR